MVKNIPCRGHTVTYEAFCYGWALDFSPVFCPWKKCCKKRFLYSVNVGAFYSMARFSIGGLLDQSAWAFYILVDVAGLLSNTRALSTVCMNCVSISVDQHTHFCQQMCVTFWLVSLLDIRCLSHCSFSICVTACECRLFSVHLLAI